MPACQSNTQSTDYSKFTFYQHLFKWTQVLLFPSTFYEIADFHVIT